MRGLVSLVALCACDQVFGLHHTTPLPQYFDAPIDAPFACPPAGTAPQFSDLLDQDFVEPVTEYTISSATGQAMGFEGDTVVAGPVDEAMQTASGFPGGAICGACTTLYHPRLAPEGDAAYVILVPPPTIVPQQPPSLTRYQLGSDGTWTRGVAASLTVMAGDFISSLSRGPERRVLLYSSDVDEFAEYSIDDASGAATPGMTYTTANAGIAYISNPMLSTDGLRMVFTGTNDPTSLTFAVYYSDRADVSQAFGSATLLANVPLSDDGQEYLNDDCSRIYVSGLGSVFYVRRQ